MDHTDVLKSIGLAARARKVVFGSALTLESVSLKKTVLVLMANDASENTKKRVLRCCVENNTEHQALGCDGGTLAHALGKNKPLAVIGITDENLSVLIKSKLGDINDNNASLMTFSESEV